MEKLTRVSLTLSEDLLKELDEFLSRTKYASRSEAIRDALQAFLSEQRQLRGEKGECAGVAILLYDHETPGLVDKLLDLQHSAGGRVMGSHHIHLSPEECLETIALKGEAGELGELVTKMGALRGVKFAKFVRVKG
ncbi:MAG: nickel-responsive transcriptional regulator NikR [Candidatus Hadarchaeales archaeon]